MAGFTWLWYAICVFLQNITFRAFDPMIPPSLSFSATRRSTRTPRAIEEAGANITADCEALAGILQSGQIDLFKDLEDLAAKGPRMSGSKKSLKAVRRLKKWMEWYGFDDVWLQPVTVPHWVRGKGEYGAVTPSPERLLRQRKAQSASPALAAPQAAETGFALEIAALGLSVGTDGDEIDARVVEVLSVDQVFREGPSGKFEGRIVFYNGKMDTPEKVPNQFDAYNKDCEQRYAGPSAAGRFGAVAVLVRSVTPLADDHHPHTGALFYDPDFPRVPAAALSTHSANLLSDALKDDPRLTVQLYLPCENREDAESYNVVAEIRGRELPDEYVVVSGHLDSWDLGRGAQDDGVGIVQTMGVGRALLDLELRPRRTVRFLLAMAEEQGGFGGAEYARQAQAQGERHVAAVESDRGAFKNWGFSYNPGDGRAEPLLIQFEPYLAPLKATARVPEGSGSDVGWLEANGAVCFGLAPDSTRYFDYHHSALDQIEAVDRDLLQEGAGALAVFTYLLAEVPELEVTR